MCCVDGFFLSVGRLLRFRLRRPVSTVMLSATLLELISSLLRSLKILSPLLTTVMYAPTSFIFLIFYSWFTVIHFLIVAPHNNICYVVVFLFFSFLFFFPCQVPHVNRTDYQLIDISEDGFVSCNNFLLFDSPIIIIIVIIIMSFFCILNLF